ncbi:uncharacterized protein OCT59_020356 [Rhizophagus irregularis]|uniref:Uncharacterized protein n=1 Tax=Rhizophagus irregularis (strain DAOM 181602 / DAOM 197198 / MUCL 43194) TaxID=747089 RepID=U9TLN5_RHIID|nr:hypothetical protein OCT59_020356 [Rhizophagus irregularis]
MTEMVSSYFRSRINFVFRLGSHVNTLEFLVKINIWKWKTGDNGAINRVEETPKGTSIGSLHDATLSSLKPISTGESFTNYKLVAEVKRLVEWLVEKVADFANFLYG